MPEKITELTVLTDPVAADLLAVVDDAAGSPLLRKLEIAKLLELLVADVVVQVKTVGIGTYTPTTGMKKVLAILVGGGGGGQTATATDESAGGGGGGGTAIKLFSAADIGASKPYVVGDGGVAGASGGTSTLGSGPEILQATGGATGGVTGASTVTGVSAAGGAGGVGTLGDLNVQGQPGGRSVQYDGTNGQGGRGGRSTFGMGGQPGGSNVAGNPGTLYGGGGSGGHASGTPNRDGGAGAAGVLYLIEFLNG